MHHARWMSKAIYSLKLVLLEVQMELTAKEKPGLKELTLRFSRLRTFLARGSIVFTCSPE